VEQRELLHTARGSSLLFVDRDSQLELELELDLL